MKRTGEITLGIIGIILSALGFLFGLFFLVLFKSEEFKSEMMLEIANDPTLSYEEVDAVITFFSGLGGAIIVAAILGVIAGIIGVIFVKGNKKPKAAGWLFIIGAILVGLISMGSGFLAALLFLIAGIMCFVRKAPVEPSDIQTNF
ncbi:DUF4064 domain-containing protein [Bacillus niameyensis]|uniref:DUF4064 domain-containing protein n=1 Tax=Bacillus niameyensis TaxID=1522308 RepID=UPI000783128B|nr:DUF4064 domain-containing protein [Bacillus niameyensis]